MSEVIDRITSIIGGFDARVQAAPADSWDNASPCADWAARDVVSHVAGNLLNLAGVMSDSQLPPAADGEAPDALWGRARDAFLGSIGSADLTKTAPGPMGPMPLEQLIGRLVATDTLVHTWDLARATGGDEQLPEDYVAGAYSGLKPMDAMIRRPGVFGAKVASADGASLQAEFLNFLGRDV